MKKALLYGIVGVVALVLFASCGMVPLDLNGTWNLVSGDYEYDDGEDDWEETYVSGTLTINDESFSLEAERNREEDPYFEMDTTISGSGFVSVNSKDKTITFFYTEFEMVQEVPDLDYEKTTTRSDYSESAYYQLNGNELTYSAEYIQETDNTNNVETEYTESSTIKAQRSQ